MPDLALFYENANAERKNGILKQEFATAKLNVDLTLTTNLIRNAIKIYHTIRPYFSNSMLTPTQMYRPSILKPKRCKSKNLNNKTIVQV